MLIQLTTIPGHNAAAREEKWEIHLLIFSSPHCFFSHYEFIMIIIITRVW